MNYVKVQNGVITGGPFGLSDNPSVSPNVNWPKSQMDIWGYVIVDLSYNRAIEKLDMDNPVIHEDGSVTYNKIALTTDEITANQKQATIDGFIPNVCLVSIYEKFSDRPALIKEWAGLIIGLVQFKNFTALKDLANTNLTGVDLTDFKSVFSDLGVDLDTF